VVKLISKKEDYSSGEEEMPRRKEATMTFTLLGFTIPLAVIIYLLIAILVLKGLGLLKLWFNLDPDGITLTFDVGSLIGSALFVLLFNRLNTLNDKLSDQGERIAKLETKNKKEK